MKSTHLLRAFLAGSSLLIAPALHADTLYWDGTDSDANTADGGNGTWDNTGTTLNWDTAPSAGSDDFWDSSVPDDAVFGGAAGLVSTAGNITAGSISFNTAGYEVRLGDGHVLTVNNISASGGGVSYIKGTIGNTADKHFVDNGGSLLTIQTATSADTFSFAQIGSTNSRFITMQGSGGTTISGPGDVNMRLTKNTSTGGIKILGGNVMINTDTDSVGTNNVELNGGVIRGYYNYSFTRALGSGDSQYQVTGGVSGFGGNGVVRFSNNSNLEVQWGSAFFKPSTLVLQGTNMSSGTINFQNKLDLNGANRNVAVLGTGTSVGAISGVIRDSVAGTGGGLTKTGSGRLDLTGANTYDGATNVNEGTLLIRGNQSTALGAVTVASGATLGGAGTVGGDTTVNGNGTLAAGNNAVGTMTFVNALQLASSSTYLYELNGGGTTADLSNVGGTLNLTDAILDLVQLGTYTDGDKFTLFGYNAAKGLTGTFAGLADDSAFTQAGGEWVINYNDTVAGSNGGTGDTFVTITAGAAVPEPSAALLGAIGFLALLRRRR